MPPFKRTVWRQSARVSNTQCAKDSLNSAMVRIDQLREAARSMRDAAATTAENSIVDSCDGFAAGCTAALEVLSLELEKL